MQRWFMSLAIAVGLAGCGDIARLGSSGGGVPSLALVGGGVTAQGPEGYCIDSRTSRPARGFAVMASCALISDRTETPGIEGLITVQVGGDETAGVAGQEQTLATLLNTAAGAALLSSTGTAEDISVELVETTPGVVTVYFTDLGDPFAQGIQPLEWRAFLDVRGRLTTVSVRGYDRDPLGRDDGLRLLNRAVASLRAANGVSG